MNSPGSSNCSTPRRLVILHRFSGSVRSGGIAAVGEPAAGVPGRDGGQAVGDGRFECLLGAGDRAAQKRLELGKRALGWAGSPGGRAAKRVLWLRRPRSCRSPRGFCARAGCPSAPAGPSHFARLGRGRRAGRQAPRPPVPPTPPTWSPPRKTRPARAGELRARGPRPAASTPASGPAWPNPSQSFARHRSRRLPGGDHGRERALAQSQRRCLAHRTTSRISPILRSGVGRAG